MIRDTSAQDLLVGVKPNRKRQRLFAGIGLAVLVALALALPTAMRLFSADASVSASRLSFATFQRGLFVRGDRIVVSGTDDFKGAAKVAISD